MSDTVISVISVISVITAVIIMGGMGILFGILLGVASKIFAVDIDERIPLIADILPGANCGGCGYAGCSAYAAAICSDDAKTNLCPVGGDSAAKKIAEIIGKEAVVTEKKVAHVMCRGCNDVAVLKFKLEGVSDCRSAAALAGGNKVCSYGCLGFGSCIDVCLMDAISIENGIAVIDQTKCHGCGTCVRECPKNTILLIPASTKYIVSCRSVAKGKDVRNACTVGCIGCGICAKNCPNEAIIMENNLAHIDSDMCTGCGICATKCPQKSIVVVH